MRYPMTAVVTVVFTSCPTRGGQQRNQFRSLRGRLVLFPDIAIAHTLVDNGGTGLAFEGASIRFKLQCAKQKALPENLVNYFLSF